MRPTTSPGTIQPKLRWDIPNIVLLEVDDGRVGVGGLSFTILAVSSVDLLSRR